MSPYLAAAQHILQAPGYVSSLGMILFAAILLGAMFDGDSLARWLRWAIIMVSYGFMQELARREILRYLDQAYTARPVTHMALTMSTMLLGLLVGWAVVKLAREYPDQSLPRALYSWTLERTGGKTNGIDP